MFIAVYKDFIGAIKVENCIDLIDYLYIQALDI
jgi:hypothetical protein